MTQKTNIEKTFLIISLLISFSSITSYTYWSSFNLPLNGKASIELLFSSSFEFIVLGGLIITIAYTVANIFKNVVDKHPHIYVKAKRPDSIFYMLLSFVVTLSSIFHMVIAPSSSGQGIVVLLLTMTAIYQRQAQLMNNYNHEYTLSVQRLSSCHSGTRGNDIFKEISAYDKYQNPREDEYQQHFFIVSFIVLTILGVSIANIKAKVIKDSIAYSYIEKYNGEKLKYIGYAMDSNVLMDSDGTLIFRSKLEPLKYKKAKFDDLF